jgi:hypothetical protein
MSDTIRLRRKYTREIVEVPVECCYPPDDKGWVMWCEGRYSYAWGKPIKSPEYHEEKQP